MRLTSSLSIALSVVIMLSAATISQAATPAAKVTHHRVHIAKAPDPPPRRICDWIGPGGRAVYRCTYVDPEPLYLSQSNAAPQHSCDWIGPGARAVYRCR